MKLSHFCLLAFAFVGLSCSSGDEDLLAQGSTSGSQIKIPGYDDEGNPDPDSTGEDGSGRSDSGLPYKINFDVAAFMNCPGDTVPNDSVFFTFKLGAYITGLQLDPDFADSLDESSSEKERQLQGSSLINAQAQLTLSQTGSPGRIASLGGSGGKVLDSLVLNQPFAIRKLAEDGISHGLTHGAKVEMQLPWPGNSLDNLFPDLNTRLTAYLTYNNGQNHTPLSRGRGLYYGSRFHFGFNSNRKILREVRSYDLATDRSHGEWACPENLRFLIHRNSAFTRQVYQQNQKYFDQNNISAESECQPDESALDGWYQDLFNTLITNNTFSYGKTVKWHKGSDGRLKATQTNQRCIQPTEPRYSCYTSDTARVEFDEANCTINGMDSSGRHKVKVCPSWLSICVRNVRR